MVTIEQRYNGLTIDGHANFAEQGKDIVCAAVSVLAQTLIASIEELTDDDKAQLKQVEDDIEAQQEQRRGVWAEYGKQNPVVAQLIDLALLQNGLLRGEALSKFIRRSVDLIK